MKKSILLIIALAFTLNLNATNQKLLYYKAKEGANKAKEAAFGYDLIAISHNPFCDSSSHFILKDGLCDGWHYLFRSRFDSKIHKEIKVIKFENGCEISEIEVNNNALENIKYNIEDVSWMDSYSAFEILNHNLCFSHFLEKYPNPEIVEIQLLSLPEDLSYPAEWFYEPVWKIILQSNTETNSHQTLVCLVHSVTGLVWCESIISEVKESENQILNNFRVFPVPSNEFISFRVNTMHPCPLEYKIIDINGLISITGKLDSYSLNEDCKIDISSLQNGVYIFYFSIYNKIYSKVFIKNDK